MASIIGAMVVAPLGGTIMAFAGALVTARFRWQTITFVQVVAGALLVVGIGFGVSFLILDLFVLTPSIDARTAPGLFDLGVALAAGAAGAYVAVRRTGSDALPGVAIAVSLVPPLAAGICLELGASTTRRPARGCCSSRTSRRSPLPRRSCSSCAARPPTSARHTTAAARRWG